MKRASTKASLPPQKLAKHCSLGPQSCAMCYWMKHGARLQHKHTMPESQVSWLQAVHSAEGLRIGCAACCAFVQNNAEDASTPSIAASPFAWFPVATVSTTLKNISRHEETAGHQAAVKAFLSTGSAQEQPSPEEAAPTEWASVWAFFRKERYMEQKSTEVVHRAKGRKMQFCLAEALRHRQQKHLRDSCCATLSLDEADTRLLVRFTAVDPNLQVWSGVLGMDRSKDTGHQSVLKCLDRVLRTAATTLPNAPAVAGGEVKEEPTFDDDLYTHLRRIVLMWNSDAGPDEVLAAKEAQRVPLSQQQLLPLLPNLVMVNRDRAHASRRPGEI